MVDYLAQFLFDACTALNYCIMSSPCHRQVPAVESDRQSYDMALTGSMATQVQCIYDLSDDVQRLIPVLVQRPCSGFRPITG